MRTDLRLPSIFRRGTGFYELFDGAAGNITDAARLLRDRLDATDDGELGRQIRWCQRRGSELTAAIERGLHQEILPPFDPEDVWRLSTHLDDVVDDIVGASELLVLCDVTVPGEEIVELADLLMKSAEANASLIAKLRGMRGMGSDLETIDRLESDADRVYRRCLARLFTGGFDAFEVLRRRDVARMMESAINGLEAASDVVHRVRVRHA